MRTRGQKLTHGRSLRRDLLAACALLCLAVAGFAQTPEVIELWPEGVPDLRADAGPEKNANGRYTNIHHPTMLVVRPPAGQANGTAVIYCPGGGYERVSFGENGGPEARAFVDWGVTVFILKYRNAEYGHPAPLRDVLRAVRLVRSRAQDFNVQLDRVGIFGASAGGHLAGCAATMWDAAIGRTGAPLDAVSARPDFAILLYAVVTMAEPFAHKSSRKNLLGADPSPALIEQLSLEKHVRADMPPIFLAATAADKTVPVENSLQLYSALRAVNVPVELHLYPTGNHGNSLDPQYGPTAQWPARVQEWMRFNHWLPARAEAPATP